MRCIYIRVLYWRDAFANALGYCIEGMHLSIYRTVVLEGCILQYTRLLYWRDAFHNTLDYCIGGMYFTIHGVKLFI